MATAGLAAGAIEGREGGAAGEGGCLNCGAKIEGRFCSHCGQSAHPHRSLFGVLEEFLHGVLHFDTKAWRTLPMVLFRPGTLTRNWVHGKRARYISPLALFLFCIFAMFFAFAFVQPAVEFSGPSADQRALIDAELADARERLAVAEADGAMSEEDRAALRADIDRFERGLAAASVAYDEAGARRSWQEMVSSAAKSGDFVFLDGLDDLNARINKKLENPDYALYKVQQTAYKFSFLLAPLSLPFIALLFLWKRGLTLYDHMVYALYALSFASILFIVMVLAAPVPWMRWLPGLLFTLGLPLHTFFHLKGAYALSWWSALWRTVLMLIFATIILMVFVIAIFLLGLGAV